MVTTLYGKTIIQGHNPALTTTHSHNPVWTTVTHGHNPVWTTMTHSHNWPIMAEIGVNGC